MTLTTERESIDARLSALSIELPKVPKPIANFAPYQRHGSLVFLAGQVCEWNGEVRYIGRVGLDYDLAEGQKAARVCGLNLIAALKMACGGTLDSVVGCVRLGGFVNCSTDFLEIPQVINGASDLMHELFGPFGSHARTAVGVVNLPRGAAVEVDAIFALG
jgi:enamine deaminase RidA (YjgF/YER057c/UK114 family)